MLRMGAHGPTQKLVHCRQSQAIEHSRGRTWHWLRLRKAIVLQVSIATVPVCTIAADLNTKQVKGLR